MGGEGGVMSKEGALISVGRVQPRWSVPSIVEIRAPKTPVNNLAML
jgi:hypothetical protein